MLCLLLLPDGVSAAVLVSRCNSNKLLVRFLGLHSAQETSVCYPWGRL